MSVEREKKKNKKKSVVGGLQNDDLHHQLITWKQKKNYADREEQVIGKEVEELLTWTSLIEAMDDRQLKDYVLNRPENLQSVKIAKSATTKRAQRNTGKPKSTSSNGLMDAIWKFHREDQDEETASAVTIFQV